MRRVLRSLWGISGCLSQHTARHSTNKASGTSQAAAPDTRESSANSAAAPKGAAEENEDVITPWSVQAKGPKGINYDRVLTTFKAGKVDAAALQHMRDVIAVCHARANAGVSANNDTTADSASFTAGQRVAAATTRNTSATPHSTPSSHQRPPPALHHFFTRDIAFSHRDLHLALKDIEETSKPGRHTAFLYTGRGPSAGSMHIGHVLPFLLTKYLQEVFNLPLVIQITDDEKYLFRDVPFEGEKADELIRNNIKDIIAFGFDPRHTFIFRNSQYMGEMYPTVLPLQRCMTASAVKHTLGIVDSDNVGKFAFPATQAAPCFSSSFRRVLQNGGKPMRCLIPCAIDQDPFFVLTRAAAARLKQPPPALLHTKFLPALKGLEHKMSSSAEKNGVITLHDTDKQVRSKMRKAFSGGSATLAQMQASGANLEVDVAYQYLRFFCPDDAVFDEVTAKYSSGEMNSGEVKDLAADFIINTVLRDWRERRAKVTDTDLVDFCSIRNILL